MATETVDSSYRWPPRDGECFRDGCVQQQWQTRLFDCTGGDLGIAEQVLGWPHEYVETLRWPLLAAQAGMKPPLSERCEKFQAAIVASGGSLTPAGEDLDYHLSEWNVQKAAEDLGDVGMQQHVLGDNARVLDVGCGAGQTLNLLSGNGSFEWVGIDRDLSVLALGSALTRQWPGDLRFVRGSAHDCPFVSEYFTHVVCRVALNYMNQSRALQEMSRVLVPGGFMLLRVEAIGHDFKKILGCRGLKQRLSRVYDLFLGVGHQLIGVQMTPGRRYHGRRAYCSLNRLTKTLKRADCEVVEQKCVNHFHAMPSSYFFVARKNGAPN